jgi:hypothetical protein
VHAARADDGEQPVVGPLEDRRDVVAPTQNDFRLFGGQGQLVEYQRRRQERDDLLDALVANVLAGTGEAGSHRSVSLFRGVYVLALHGRSGARGVGARSVETSDADGLPEADRAPS